MDRLLRVGKRSPTGCGRRCGGGNTLDRPCRAGFIATIRPRPGRAGRVVCLLIIPCSANSAKRGASARRWPGSRTGFPVQDWELRANSTRP
jgi:hypothetical protein